MANLLDGAISFWKFDENAGSVVADNVRTNNGLWEGTLGSQWTTGLIGSGGNFNGTDNDVKILHNANLVPTAGITVAIWLKPDATQVAFSSPISKNNEFYFENFGDTTNVYRFTVLINSVEQNSGYTAALGTTSFSLLLGTYEQSTGYHAIYVNNSLANSATHVGNYALTGGTNDLYIGNRTGFSRQFKGVIDSVGIWNRVLTSSERTLFYNNGAGLQYPFNDNRYGNYAKYIRVDNGMSRSEGAR